MTKTKEMIVDCRRQEHSPGNTIIHNNEVEIVSKYKYLGTIFDGKLKWDNNTEETVKKGQQRLYLLRKLNILNQEFTTLPSGRRLRCPICKTNRFKNSFMPVAVRLLNNP